jgi:hypothetical protein
VFGYVTVLNRYEKFADGTKLTLLLNRVSDKYYAVDFDFQKSSDMFTIWLRVRELKSGR